MSEGAAATAQADGSRLLPFLQLLRLPNVFTAMADVTMGYFVVHRQLESPLGLLLLVAASCSLYLSGMVLNDVYDFAIDARERPARPLPSGRISRSLASRLGYGLLLAGTLLGWLAGVTVAGAPSWWRSGVIATTLALCIWLYDAVLKSTPAGPLVMGSCRLLNVLLGMSFAAWSAESAFLLGFTPFQLAVAGGIGVYIAGVTVFARSEAERSPRPLLACGLLIMAAGILLLAGAPRLLTPAIDFRVDPRVVWPATLALLSITIFHRGALALITPGPRQVQAAVKHCILSLIVLDAAVCLLVGPTYAAVGVLALLAPTLLLGRWVYST